MSAGKGLRKFREALFGKKEAQKQLDTDKKIKSYITGKKKGSLAGDLVNYGIPAVTGGIIGGLAGLAGGPVAGVAGSAIGSKIGKELIATKINKVAGFKYGGAVGKTGMHLIHEGEYVLPAGVKPTAEQRRRVMVGQNGAGVRKLPVMFV
jgi:hypothetical protein